MMPRYLTGERRLISSRENEASPRSPAGRRRIASFSSWKTRRRLVPARGDTRYCPVAGGLHTSILSDQYKRQRG
ncbi:hypothetical protein BHE74_00013945 [Ensete ventricosum]|nr:hypothetical protein BHE74_00013945 [Ensete ventricosum]